MSESRVLVLGSKPVVSERRVNSDRRAAHIPPGPDFAYLANSIPQLVWTCDASGARDYFNQRWFDYVGTTFEQSAGNGWQYAVHAEDLERTLLAWEEANRSGQECVVEHRLRHRSGEYRWNLTKAVPMRAADGSIIRWFGTCTDVQEQKESQSRQQERTKRQVKARLSSHLAHEINNPLNATMNLLYLAQVFPRKSKMFVASAEEQVRKIAATTAEILRQK